MKVTQSCLTLCDPIDYTVHGLLQTRILEWVAFPFYKGSSQPRDQTQVSHIVGEFFTSRAKWNHKNAEVDTLSLLQWIKCESWMIKKAEGQRTDVFKLWCWRRLLRSLGQPGIKPVSPKGFQPWIFIGRTDAEADAPILCHPI